MAATSRARNYASQFDEPQIGAAAEFRRRDLLAVVNWLSRITARLASCEDISLAREMLFWSHLASSAFRS